MTCFHATATGRDCVTCFHAAGRDAGGGGRAVPLCQSGGAVYFRARLGRRRHCVHQLAECVWGAPVYVVYVFLSNMLISAPMYLYRTLLCRAARITGKTRYVHALGNATGQKGCAVYVYVFYVRTLHICVLCACACTFVLMHWCSAKYFAVHICASTKRP